MFYGFAHAVSNFVLSINLADNHNRQYFECISDAWATAIYWKLYTINQLQYVQHFSYYNIF